MFFRLLLSVNIFFSTIVFANNIDTALELTKEGKYEEAFEIIEIAVKNNELRGFGALGFYNLHGFHIKQDCSQAYKYLELAANGGHAPSMNHLTILAMPPDELDQPIEVLNNALKCAILNEEKAFIYATKSAELENAEGLFNLGYLYEKGIYVDKDYNQSIKYYKLASGLGYSDATLNLISNYMQTATYIPDIKILSKKLILDNKHLDKTFYYLGLYYLNNETEFDFGKSIFFLSSSYYLADEKFKKTISKAIDEIVIQSKAFDENFDETGFLNLFDDTQLDLADCKKSEFKICDEIIDEIKLIN